MDKLVTRGEACKILRIPARSMHRLVERSGIEPKGFVKKNACRAPVYSLKDIELYALANYQPYEDNIEQLDIRYRLASGENLRKATQFHISVMKSMSIHD